MKLKSMSRKKKILLIIIILILALTALRIITSDGGEPEAVVNDAVNIKVTTVGLTTLENTSLLTGRLEPVEEVALVSKAVGEVTNVYVELGQKVKKGTVLFELDKTQIATTYNQAKASYEAAQVNLDRIEHLYQQGAVSLQQYEQAKTQFTIAKESYAAAGEGMSNYVVTSPIDGYITSVNVDVGAVASQATAAVTIANIDKLEIDTSLSESIINKIKIGDKVEVRVPSVSEAPFSGVVTALSPAPAVGSLTYPMKVTLDNKDASIKPGMFAEVTIASDRLSDIIAIPSNAVLIKSGKTVVATIEGGEKVVFKEVVVGVDNGELAEIKSGIKAGDTVVIEGQHYLEESSKFHIID